MKIVDYVTAAKAASPNAFGSVADARAAKIVAAVLAEIAKKIDATVEGPVPVVRFGRFVVKRVQVKPQAPQPGVPAKPVPTGPQRRVIFQRAKPAAKVVTVRK